MKKYVIAAMFLFAFASAAIIHGASENSLIDENSRNTLIAESDATAGEITRLKGDAALGALYVSGLGAAGCSTITVQKQGLAASATATVTFAATSTLFIVTTESTNTDNIYMLPSATVPTANTGIEMLPTDSIEMTARATKVTLLNGSGSAAATATVIVCY